MNIYNNIIKYILNKETYNKYSKLLYSIIPHNFEYFNILEVINHYFNSSEKDILSVEDLEVSFFSAYPAMRPKDADIYRAIFKAVGEADADPTLVEDYFSKLYKRYTSEQLATLLINKGEWDSEADKLLEELRSGSAAVVEDIQYVSNDLTVLLEAQTKEPGLEWPLESLNRALGPLRKGDFGFVFARPETGKTTFLAHSVTFMAQQAEGPVLWFNNEEQGNKVSLRCYQSYFGVTLNDLFSNPRVYGDSYSIRERLRIVDEAVLRRSYIERLVERESPSIIVFDQIDKIYGFDGDRNDLELGAIYQWARELAKRYCPVIGICQAGATGEGKEFLTMDDVVNAKTSKQAEADWILGIGKVHQPGKENYRYFNISKNKLMGGPRSDPAYRHGQITTLILPEIARYKDILKWD